MKIVKFLLIALALIVLLVFITVGIFLVTFDANQYKQDLSELVKQQTGRDLEFEGDIGLTLYPALGMQLGSMTFSNAVGFESGPMLSVDTASVSVDVFSLLRFQPEVAQLVLDGLSIDLQKNSSGMTNWDDLLPKQDGEPTSTDSADKQDPGSATGIDIQGAFAGLNITDAKLKWKDASAGVEYEVQSLSLITGKITLGESFPLQLNMLMRSVNEFSTELELTTDVLLEKETLTLSSLKISSLVSGKLVPVDSLQVNLTGDVDFELPANLLSVKGFNTTIKTTGGVLQSSDSSISGEIGFDLNQQQLIVGVLDIHSELQGTAVPNGLLKASVSASKLDVKLNQRAVTLEGLVLALNENQFKGNLKVQDYAQPALSFALSSDLFDVDKLMGVADKVEPEQPEKSASPAEDIQIQLPMELLRDLKLDGKLEVGRLITQGLTINDVLVKIDADKGILDVKPITINLYEGSLDGVLQVNVQAKEPAYLVRQKLSSFQIGLFLKDFMDDDMISGDANLDIKLTTKGEWLSQLKSQLNGELAVLVKDGALNGFNLRHKIETAKAKLTAKKAPELVERKTDFSALSLSGLINNGVLTTDDLDMQTPLLRVGGKGAVDIAKEKVDYMVNAKLVMTSEGQGGDTADDLTGLLIPVAIVGSWYAPEFDVQLDDMLKAKLNAEKAKVRESVAKQKAQLQKKLDDEKNKLKAAKQKQLDAKKLQLQKQQELAVAEQKAKLQAEKQRQQAELDAKKQAEKERAKKKLEDKLKKLF